MDSQLTNFLKRAGWRQKGDAWHAGARTFSVTVEDVPGSWDRTLAPFLAKAILEARAKAGEREAVAVLKVKRATPLSDERLSRFVSEVSPEQSWILMDHEGRFFPHVQEMASLQHEASSRFVVPRPAPVRAAPSLFTDLHQWMLKVLLAPFIEDRLLRAPRHRAIRNASTLAEAAEVSVPAASRFLHALEDAGQLDRRFGDLRVARPLELLERWRDQVPNSARHEIGVVAVRGFRPLELSGAVVQEHPRRTALVLALHVACDELGVGHVKGAIPAVYSSVPMDQLESMGFVTATSDRVDLVLRTPRFERSLYRGMVTPRGIPTADVIQCWLDTSHHRVRGREQADFIWRKVFARAFDE